jgi:hypothetical protein
MQAAAYEIEPVGNLNRTGKMVLTARLYIQGHKTESTGIPLITCDFQFDQEVDQKGMPVSEVRGGRINMTFSSMEDEELIQWMLMPTADKDGKIVFSETDASKDFKKLEFTDGRLIHYRESFARDQEMIEELTISARELSLSGATHWNLWVGYNK